MLKFFTPAAFEQRARDRERRTLVVELERQPFILSRLAKLDQLDSIAALEATRAAARKPDAAVHLVHPTCVAS